VPQSIVSDRDPIFMSTFWRELMRLVGTKLHMTTAFHPQSDGQSEAANRVIIMYLRCLTGDRPHHWPQWLPWRSSSSIRRTKAHFRTPRSGWSTDTNHQPSGPMSRGTHGWWQLPKTWKNAMNSSQTSTLV
jgi:hypothetical protein